MLAGGHARGRGHGYVGAEGQLGVDGGLPGVGGGEDAEIDAEGEQQPDDHEAAIDRGPPSARTGQQKTSSRVGPAPCRLPREPGKAAAPQPDEQQSRADPQQRRGEEHVDGEREGRVGVGVDDGREARAGRQPVDQGADRQGEPVEVEPLPERLALAAPRAATVCDAGPQHGDAGADPCRGGAGDRQADAGGGGDGGACECEPDAALDHRGDGEEGKPGTGKPGDQADHRALHACHHQEVAAGRSARPQQGEVAAISLDGSQRRQVGEAERDQRPGNGEHDVEGVGIEGVAGGGVERVREVVDELDLARKGALDLVAGAIGEVVGRPSGCPSRAAPDRAAPGPATGPPSAHRAWTLEPTLAGVIVRSAGA